MKKLFITILLNALSVIITLGQSTTTNFSTGKYSFTLFGELKGFKANFSTSTDAAGVECLRLNLTSKVKITPSGLSLKWSVPVVNIQGIWSPSRNLTKHLNPNWRDPALHSRATTNAPVVLLYGYDGNNALSFACSDALNSLNLLAGVDELNSRVNCEVQLFNEAQPDIHQYDITIRLDDRPIPYYQALKNVSQWWESMSMYKPAAVPLVAKMPMYSTWYSYHQNFTAQQIEEECRLAALLGCKAVIEDDGWQTVDNSQGYAFTGDWEPLRVPDMKGHVKKIHEAGLKFILWYSVPFVGEQSKAYNRFKGKYLSHQANLKAYVLDPRFPEVRAYLISKYVNALKEWDLDGFKLDFVDSFVPDEHTSQNELNGRDYLSINDAVDRLLTDVMTQLREVKPDVMVEFRQTYIGPLMRKYGNLFRANDSPNDALLNRVRVTDVRLLSGNTAVHSDMMMWNVKEKPELAALQLLNALFSVPQISVRLNEIPANHKAMLAFWLKFWTENRSVLLDGEFKPEHPELNYPVISSSNDQVKITAVFAAAVVKTLLNTKQTLNVVNASLETELVLDVTEDAGNREISIFNCEGKEISKQIVQLKKGLVKYTVPPSGLLKIK